MDRRRTLKWMMSAATAVPLLARARSESAAAPPSGFALPSAAAQPIPAADQNPSQTARPYGTDPDLTKTYHPGDLWPLTLNSEQRRTATVLCDIVIPADSVSRSASEVGVVDFLDEWISAPYPNQQKDRTLLLEGLRWMDAEAARRFEKAFADLSETQQHAICDDLCSQTKAAAEFAKAAEFFARYRDLTAGGFYTSPEGRRDLGYIGNVPLARFGGPPADLLRQLGLI